MKLFKNLFSSLALILVTGGTLVLAWEYFRNKQLFVVLLSNSIVKGSMRVLQTMGIALLAVILGLVFFVISLKIGSAVRRSEREKREALREQQREADELKRQLQKEAEEAKAEAEEARAETERIRLSFKKEEKEEEKKED
jgi:ABC-type transport system involved in cytochrome bd biosynthesis fused ATPase/permease subunit